MIEKIDAGLPRIQVLVLGASGSGKTVYLASLGRRLGVQYPEVGFYLRSPLTQAGRLRDVYSQVADPGRPWPPPSKVADGEVFSFTCAIRHEGANRPVFTIDYQDYAGELISADGYASDATAEFDADIEQAHVLLCLIDGQRMVELLNGEHDGRRYFEETMQPTYQKLQEHSTGKPMHFVLTKWDLVAADCAGDPDQESARLALVAERLRQIPEIHQLAGGHAATVRLIPVSAVGFGYARLEDGKGAVKIPGRSAYPVDVEIPLTAIMPDLLDQALATIQERAGQRIAALSPGAAQQWAERIAWKAGESRASVVAVATGLVERLSKRPASPATRFAVDGVVQRAIDALMRAPGRRQVAIDDIHGTLDEAERFRKLAIERFRAAMQAYEGRMPASVLRSVG